MTTTRTTDATPGDADAKIPAERDEAPSAPVENAQHHANRSTMRQAHDDVESGVRDTERIGTPNDVPSAATNDHDRS